MTTSKTSELFKMLAVRGPRKLPVETAGPDYVTCEFIDNLGPDTLARLREDGLDFYLGLVQLASRKASRQEYAEAATAYIRKGRRCLAGPEAMRTAGLGHLLVLNDLLRAKQPTAVLDQLSATDGDPEPSRVLPNAWLAAGFYRNHDGEFGSSLVWCWDNYLAWTIHQSRPDWAIALGGTLKVLAMLPGIVGGNLRSSAQVGRGLAATILLPRRVFPLPDQSVKPQPKPDPSHDAELASDMDEVSRLRLAQRELTQVAASWRAKQQSPRVDAVLAPPVDARQAALSRSGTDQSGDGGRVLLPTCPPERVASSEMLPEEALCGLTKGAWDTLTAAGIQPGRVSEESAARILETKVRAISAKYFDPSVAHLRQVIINGNLYEPPNVYGARPKLPIPSGGLPPPILEGDLPEPLPFIDPNQSVPHSIGPVKPLGIGDLLVIKQELQRYTLGEVAHIENVLSGEIKKRTHRRLNRTEEMLMRETEARSESERELETTERSEMETETAKVVEADRQREAGVTLSASYGTVAVTGHASFEAYDSAQTSDRAATSYAKDVSKRALERVTSRVLEQRKLTTIEEVEETNYHELASEGGPVWGLYRWVEKLYKAQVWNYGLRLMYQFTVPEPAAFYIYLKASSGNGRDGLDKPIAPHSVVVEALSPLGQPLTSAAAITPGNYLAWAALYGAQGIEPPPEARIVAVQMNGDRPEDSQWFTASGEIAVPAGYVARKAYVNFGTDWGPRAVYLHIGRGAAKGQSSYLPNLQTVDLNDESGTVPWSLFGTDIIHYYITIEVECHPSSGALVAWRLKTYNTILQAYQQKLSRYEEELNALGIGAGVSVQGQNPELNRRVEREELMRRCIELLTGQRFELFNAMTMYPDNSPEMDFAEAMAEGKYAQFFMQAFEWENMTYLFYPYFWGRKKNWTFIRGLEDVDPLFSRFLQAGTARVIVPVRVGFEKAILYYQQSGGSIWEGGDAPALNTELSLSIVEELKTQQCADVTEDPAALSTGDIPDLTAFVAKLVQPANDVCSYIWTRLRDVTRQAAIAYQSTAPDSSPLETLLLMDLTGLLRGESIYDSSRFAAVVLRPETMSLLASSPCGSDVVRLNRLLFEDAVPEASRDHWPRKVGAPWTVRVPTSLVMNDVSGRPNLPGEPTPLPPPGEP